MSLLDIWLSPLLQAGTAQHMFCYRADVAILGPQVHLVEIDTEEDPEIAEAAGINGTPTVQLFKNRERLHHLPGVKQKREYKSLIEASL